MATYAGRYDEPLLQMVGGRLSPAATATVTVYEADGITPAELYTDRTKATIAANPVTPDSSGNLEFFAEPGTYVLSISHRGSIVRTDTAVVPVDPGEPFDPVGTASTAVANHRTEADATAHPVIDTRIDDLETIAGTNAPVFNVVTYGATGNGVADDTAEIQAALDAANTAGGGIVWVPAGDYLISATLTLYSGVEIRGIGRESRIFTATNKLVLMQATSTTYTAVRDLFIEGTGTGSQPPNTTPADTTNSGCGIIFAGVTHGRIENVTAYNHGGNMGTPDTNGVAGIWLTYGSAWCVVTRCIVDTCRNGINEDAFFGADPTGNKIVENHVTGCVFGIALESGANGKGSLVAHNTVRSCTQPGIDVHSTSYATIADNYVSQCGGALTNAGIHVYATSATRSYRTKVTGNTCWNNGTHGIKVSDYVNEAVVSDNICVSNNRHGIYVNTDSNDLVLASNQCISNSLEGAGLWDGIHVTASSRIIVSGNLCRNSAASASKFQAYGLVSDGTADYLTLSGNDFRNNATGTILLVGSNNTVNEPGHAWIMGGQTAATHTNWNTVTYNVGYWFTIRNVSSGAVNDSVSWDVELSAGTWTIDLFHHADANRGIYSVRIDGTEVGTVDGYAAASTMTKSSVTGVSIVGGRRRVTLTMATKNASSSAHYGAICGVGLTRTA